MAAGNILAGFVKGFSGVALDQMEQRRLAEAERKKLEMLERLRRETMEEAALLEERLDSKKADDKLSTTDYGTGKKILRNSKGEQIGVLEIPQSERDLYSMELEKGELGLQDARLGLDVKRANIEQSRASAETSRAYAERARRLDSSGSSSRKGGKEKEGEDVEMLVAEYERAFEELENAGASPAVLANFQTEFHRGITEKGWDKAQQRAFLNTMRRTFTKSWRDEEGREHGALLESYRSADSILDKKLNK